MNEFKKKIAYNDKTIMNVLYSAVRLARVVALAALTHIIFVLLWYSTAAHSKSPQVYINNFDAYWQTATGFWILLVCATMLFAILQSYILGKFLRRFWSAIIYLGFTGLFLYAYDNFNYMLVVVLVALFSTSNATAVQDYITDIWKELYDESDYKAMHRFIKAEVRQEDVLFELFHDRRDGSTTGVTKHVSDETYEVTDVEPYKGEIESDIATDSTINDVLSAKFGSAEALTDDEFKQLLKDTPQDDLQDTNDLELSTEDGREVEGEISSESDLQDTNDLELSTEDGREVEGEISSESDLQGINDLELSTEDGTEDEGEISSESDLQDTNDLELSTEDGTEDGTEDDHKTHPETITLDANDFESSTEDVQEKERLDNVRRKIQEQKSRYRRRV